MSRFTWRITICTLPIALSILVIALAYHRYAEGEGGFKLGVDLAGGTDLTYEVQETKFADKSQAEKRGPEELAAALKRRIDPADLKNITIRPVGDTRVEIILPTGGHVQTRKEELRWESLLSKVAEKWPPKAYLIPVGNRIELVARINEQYPSEDVATIQKFISENYDKKIVGADAAKKDATWKAFLAEVAQKWKPKKYEAGRGRTAVLLNRVREQYPEEQPGAINTFINDNYGGENERRALTTEEVERIKELISQVGSLEFRILANTHDDKDAIDAAMKYFVEAQKDPKTKADLEALAVSGKAPPPPMAGPNDPLFDTVTGIGRYGYAWFELGKAERKIYRLDNASENQSEGQNNWAIAKAARDKGEACLINDGNALIYSRPVTNPRLAEKDADKKYEYFILTRDPAKDREVTGQFLVNARPDQNNNLQIVVAFQFNSEGAARFHEMTSKNAPEGKSEGSFRRYLAVILDGVVESAPRLNAVLSDSGIIEGGFTKKEVDRLVAVLKAGALPASLNPTPVSETTMGPTLGEDTIRSGTMSVFFAFGAVMAFMVVYYWFAGVVACVALLANLLLTVAFMVIVNATFTLPGLAGLVLTLGMAVDANVLIYERLREERERGASLTQALRNGYDKAFPTIIDTHLSSIFTAIVLYTVGNDQLKGFGISLTVGLVISLFTSLYMTRLLFDIWQYMGWLKKLTMLKLFTKPNIDFMAIRYYWFTATLIITVLGAALFFYHLDKGGLNIDFSGGTAYGGQLTEKVSMVELRNMLEKSKLPDLSIEQTFVSSPEFSEGDKSKLFTVRTSEKNRNVVLKSINDTLGDKLRKTDLKSFEIDRTGKKRATLEFVDPGTQKPAFASVAQVTMLLTEELKKAKLDQSQQFTIEGWGKEEEGRFQWMNLQFIQPVDPDKLETALKGTKAEFAATPQPERLENFDSQLAKQTQKRALYAILASWAAILMYLWFRFGSWTFGLAAVACLVHDLFFTLGAIALCHYIHEAMPGLASFFLLQDFKIDLPSVAALLTLVGYSVNDTIVVFDRIREVRGKNMELTPQIINESINQTLSRTLLTSFATWLVVIVLYIWGGEGVHLFAFVMVVGIIVGTYSSIYIASPLLLIFGEGGHANAKVPATSGQTAKALT